LHGKYRQALFVIEERQDPRKPPREHGFAHAGRAHKQQIVASGGRNFEGTTSERLPPNIGEVVAGPR
jgi:hypothetical protein